MQPNILWITTDRQRWDTLNCTGNSFVTTPNIDRLAREGALFTQAFSQNPVCAPSRASFLTGRYPRTAGLVRNAQTIPESERLVSKMFFDAGYVCGHAGKMHLSASSPEAAAWSEKRTDDGYSVFDWSMHPPATPVSPYTAWLYEHAIDFVRTPLKAEKRVVSASDQNTQNEHDMSSEEAYVYLGMPKETSNTGWIVQRAVNFINCNKNLGKPWFFTCDIEDPHSPYDPPQEFLQPYLDRLETIPLPRYCEGELDNKPPFQNIDRHGVYGSGQGTFAAADMSDYDQRLIRAAYWAMIDHVDYQVGRLIQALEHTGQWDNTIIIFMSDHGDMLGDHGIYMQGAYFYDEMVHVPLILCYPEKLSGNRRVSSLVELVDVVPTILQAAGLPGYAGIQGESLWESLTGRSTDSSHRDSVYYEYYNSIPSKSAYQQTGGAYITGIRDRKFALNCVHNLDCGELYDLVNDPGMIRNLWSEAGYQSAKMLMLKKLCDRMAQTIDPLPKAEAAY